MNPDKKIIIDDLLEKVNGSPFLLVVEYTGMTVPEFSELRNRLSQNGAECHVAKNTYMRKALAEAGMPDTGDQLSGQTAFVTGAEDVAGASKVLKSFEKEFKKPTIKLGILDGAILDE
ncbi:MAG: 50S ribosomal protein L10, partial [Verrucomicrobiota bacterium]